MARIGIFGGSFNPPHLGHMLAVREFQKKLALDLVLLIPASVPPHKELVLDTPLHRLQMTRLAAQELPGTEVSDLELRRPGLSYTADTVAALRAQYPNDELFLLMGTDMFLSFAKWYHPERITAEATLAVAHRAADEPKKLQACAAQLAECFGAKTVLVENEYLPHSSTSVRAMLAFDCAESFLAPSVLAYIREHRLYGCGEPLKHLPFEALAEHSLRLHKPSRMAHVRGCSETAAQLARHYGANEADARRAGILHDITKALNADEQLKLCEKYGIILDNFERCHPKLLHARTASVVAARVFAENEAVCAAIRWHTTGKADMSVLEKIVYLADYMEPNRDFDGVEPLRKLVRTDLDAGMLLGLRMTMEQLRAHESEIDPNSLAALRFLEERKTI